MSTVEILVAIAVLTAAAIVVRRASRPDRVWEERLRWLLPSGFVMAMESIASAHPVRYAVLVFLAWLGICALGVQAGAHFGPVVQYGVGSLLALGSVYTARASARARTT